jgi:uncharacterized Ntn-hydrolase superfamily protein
MNFVANVGTVPPPKHQAGEFVAYEAECKDVLRPLLHEMIEVAEKAGWKRRTVASALMFLAAQHVSAASSEAANGTGTGNA